MCKAVENAITAENELKKAVHLYQTGKLSAAEYICLNILDRIPEQRDSLHFLSLIAQQKGENDGAERLIRRAIQTVKHNPYYYYLVLGSILKAKGEMDDAVECFEKSIQLNPDYYETHYSLGCALHQFGDLDDAILCYKKSIELKPDFAQAYFILASLFHDLGDLKKALFYYKRTIELKADIPLVYNNMGIALQNLKKFDKAASCYKKALEIKPDYDDACVNLGNSYQELGKYNKAVVCYKGALRKNPGNAVAFLNMGIALMSMGKPEEARLKYKKALDLKPDYEKACAYLFKRVQSDCAWREFESLPEKLDSMTQEALEKERKPQETPFLNISRHSDPALNFAVAKSWSRSMTGGVLRRRNQYSLAGRKRNKKITLGYLSNNFRNHPTTQLTLGLFELHNREDFEVFCYSYGKNDGSHFRKKVENNCDKFVDLRKMNDNEASKTVFQDEVDILVDLVGVTEGSRMGISALRPAPVQVRYLGLAGTTGADCFDYIITDSIVTPENQEKFYTEKFVFLPHCYQINSIRNTHFDKKWDRETFGLPKDCMVFCSFNASYKLDPVMFDVWLNILQQVPGSALWLLNGNSAIAKNLKQEAEAKGVNSNRLVFTSKLPINEHLGRLHLADVALDTRIVNGAATTSDALWAGVPVITLQGSHFASRMSSSILSAVGLPQLVTHSLEQYKTVAVRIAKDPKEFDKLKKRLKKNIRVKPLFDTLGFIRNLERAYREMLKIYLAKEKPRRIEVAELLANDET